jgi:tetratricopeptide (TPR) repeat protein
LWGEQYSRKLADLPAIQEDISREITRKLRPRLKTTEQERLATGGTTDAGAYQLYIKGRYFWNKRDVETLKKARDYFQQAIERDPNYALAYTGLADSYALLGDALAEVLHSEEEHKEGDRKAIAASKKALEIDDTLGEAHASYAHALFDSSDFAGAEKEFKRALELNPNYASAHHWYANLLMFAGDRQDEALTEIRRAQELDPLSLIINTWVGEHLFAMNRIEEAIEQYRKVLEMDPNFIQAHANLADAYDVKGMYPEAIDESEKGLFQTPQSIAKGVAEAAQLRRAYKSAGARGYWLQKLEFEKSSPWRRPNNVEIATIYDLLGDKENAIKELHKVTPDDYWYLLFNGPYFQDLRSDPRFQDQVRRVREFYKRSSH